MNLSPLHDKGTLSVHYRTSPGAASNCSDKGDIRTSPEMGHSSISSSLSATTTPKVEKAFSGEKEGTNRIFEEEMIF
jgi:hypothetical protein